MPIQVGSRSRRYTSGIQKRAGTAALYNRSKAGGIVIDTADGYTLKYNKNGVIVSIGDSSAGGTSAKLSLNAWHAGQGAADYLSWQNTTGVPIVVTRVVMNITTKSTGAATAAIGTTVVSAITNSNNLMDALNIGAAAGVFDNLGTPGVAGKALQSLAANGWVTFHALADPSGLVGSATIYYQLA